MKNIKHKLVDSSINHYKLATLFMVLLTVAAGAFFPWVVVDTDPENMLPADEIHRVFHNQTKKEFSLSEIVVVGVVNEKDPDGAFNPETLSRVHELTEFAKTLRWPDERAPGEFTGVIEADMVAPSMTDHMSQGGPGEIRFEWLMGQPPKTRGAARAIREKAFSNPLLRGRMFSDDGQVICIYLPLTNKHLSYKIYTELQQKVAQMGGEETYHIAGLPVAEVAIGVEMFSQMAFGSPMAMVVIFALLLFFFRKLRLVILPMIIAMFSVITTMGLLIASGFPVHILSSMIPIFLMCIGVVSSIHILSEFFDIYTKEKGREESIREVMHTLFVPILYTSLTTAAGFLSLTFTSIPPARIFGAFLSIGVMIAWLYTVIFVPAYIMMIPDAKLENFGMSAHGKEQENVLTRILKATGRLTYYHAKPVLLLSLILMGVAIWGITQIRINDNYAKRFTKSHPIRQADMAFNKHLDGTYAAYLILEGQRPDHVTDKDIKKTGEDLMDFAHEIKARFPTAPGLAKGILERLPRFYGDDIFYGDYLDAVMAHIDILAEPASDEDYEAYQELRGFLGIEKEKLKVFKRPEVLGYMAGLQKYLRESGLVGKSTSLADVVCKVNQELIDGRPENFRIPDTSRGIAECFLQFQQGHRPQDLWHMVTPDYMQTNIWMQLKTGNSMDMRAVVKAVDAYIREHKPPVPLIYRWAGLHYINQVMEEKLISGMFTSFMGSFIVVFFMMAFLFRSPLWGLLCMVPLSITILAIYGIVGLSGKDYDLPIAVLGVLALGMAVDFAIHFLERSRVKYRQKGNWKEVIVMMFGEPARAISRNVMVIAIGFLPLLVAPLIPYKTMGVMLFAIMSLSGIITLVVLPSVLTLCEKWFFKKQKKADAPGEAPSKTLLRSINQ